MGGAQRKMISVPTENERTVTGMAKFVELHDRGNPMLINLDKLESVALNGKGKTAIVFCDYDMEIDESYEKVKEIIGSAQGGIPMEPGRIYDGA